MIRLQLKNLTRLTTVFTAGVLFASCSNVDGANQQARVNVLLTDAPSVMFESAIVSIGEVWLVPSDESLERVLVAEIGGTFDLLQLRDGVTASLADAVVPPGQYSQLRLVVESASVTLANGYEFDDGSVTQALKVPSGAQSGIKVKLEQSGGNGGLEITGETTLVVDFDVLQNFKIQGNPNTPAGIKSVLFTPLLRAVVFDGAGSITGSVGDGTNAVADAVVSATRQNSVASDGETSIATAITAADGTYTIRFLLPGTYEVSVESDAGSAAPVTVDVPRDTEVVVDFILVP